MIAVVKYCFFSILILITNILTSQFLINPLYFILYLFCSGHEGPPCKDRSLQPLFPWCYLLTPTGSPTGSKWSSGLYPSPQSAHALVCWTLHPSTHWRGGWVEGIGWGHTEGNRSVISTILGITITATTLLQPHAHTNICSIGMCMWNTSSSCGNGSIWTSPCTVYNSCVVAASDIEDQCQSIPYREVCRF